VDKFLCVGLVLYNPSLSHLRNIKNYYDMVEKIYVYDNSETKNETIVKALNDMKKCKYISFGDNYGMAKALNYICKKAIKDGYRYILTLDQDSVIFSSSISLMIESIKKANHKKVGIYAPEVKYIKDNKEIIRYNNKFDGGMYEAFWAITSGSILSLDVFEEVGEFDENLFIDRVDYDYCLTLRKKGYKILKVRGVTLYQFLGETNKNLVCVSQHSPIRHYYIFRNRLYILDKHRETYRGISKFLLLFFASIRHTILIVIFENHKLEKIKMVIKAIIDYKKGRMGKYYK